MRIELCCCEGPVLPWKEHDDINVAKPPSPKCWILEPRAQKTDYEAPDAGGQPKTCCFTFSSSSWTAWAVLYLEAARCACKVNSRSELCQHETSCLCFVRVCWMSLKHVLLRKTSALLSAKPARINPGITWNAFLRLGSTKAENFSPQPSVSVRDWKLTTFKGPINLKTQSRTCTVWRGVWHCIWKESIFFFLADRAIHCSSDAFSCRHCFAQGCDEATATQLGPPGFGGCEGTGSTTEQQTPASTSGQGKNWEVKETCYCFSLGISNFLPGCTQPVPPEPAAAIGSGKGRVWPVFP